MKFSKINNKGQATIFENPVLEFFTKGHPLMIWGMYIPLISFFVYIANRSFAIQVVPIILTFLLGMFLWTLFEYLMHRFVFHFISENKTATRIVYIIHGNHHEFPRDRERLFMPPLPSLILATVIFSAMFFVGWFFNVQYYAFPFFAGFVFGYLLYGSMHYAIHAWKPPFRWMKPLWRNHHLHHYRDEEHGFGVSTTLWDRVFGTMFPKNN
jgi:sterol desaturase/sphingolipid hydroxylase (fatty acid hydroxylase superfamily)